MREARKLWLPWVALLACTYDAERLQPASRVTEDPSASGSASAEGGSSVSGRASGKGGDSSVRGSASAAGGSGGSSRAGGSFDAGGSLATGGRAGAGPGGSAEVRGGSASDSSSAGHATSGGASGTGGAVGGQSAATAVGDIVTFVNAQPRGAMVGRGRISLSVLGSITSPTCMGLPITAAPLQVPAITFNCSCDPEDIVWDPGDKLCMTTTIPAWPSNVDGSVFDQDWGVLLGVSARENGEAMGVNYRTVTFEVTGMPFAELRAIVHLKSDPDNTTYCSRILSQSTLKFSNFNTRCWDDSGKKLLPEDTVKIDLVGVMVASSSRAIPLKNFCLTKIAFGR